MGSGNNALYWLVVLAGCGMSGTALGLGVNVAGLFFGPMAGEFGAGQGLVAATLTMYSLAQAFSGMVAASLVERFGFKKVAILGTLFEAVPAALIGMSPNVYLVLALNTVRGAASGVIGMVLITLMVNFWFSKNNGLMTSICMGFSGIAGALLAPVFSTLIATIGWRASYLVVAALTVAFNLPAMLAPISLHPEDRGMTPYGGVPRPKAAAGAKDGAPAIAKAPIALVIMLMVYGVCAAAATALPQHFPGIAASYGLAATGTLMVSTGMVANSAGKVLIGVLVDHLGPKVSISLIAILVALGAALMVFVPQPMVLIVAAGLFGLCYSLSTVGAAMLTRDVFGPELYSGVYPKVVLAVSLSNAAFTTIVGALYDLSGGYAAIVLMLGAMEIVAICLTLLAYRVGTTRRKAKA